MDPKFSVIIPLYNVGAYLADTVSSVLAQSIGFEENIQLILVNDGSADDTEQISLKFRDAYPDNITYVYQDNAGVSAARNAGIPYIRGKYTNFMDADDLWDPDAFEKVWAMFEEQGDGISVVACRVAYFEGASGFHNLDYKFRDGNMICDIFEHPTYGQFSVNSAFCRSEDIRELAFDTRLSYGEDAGFINRLILKDHKYGLLADAVYHLRKRDTGVSLTQTKLGKPTAYTDTARYYYKFMADLSAEIYGRMIPYVQYALINAFKHRITSAIPDSIPAEVRQSYIELMTELIARLDDEVICSAPKVLTETRLCLLQQKYGLSGLKSRLSVRNGFVYCGGHRAGRLFRKDCIAIKKVKRSLLKTKISGTIRCPEVVDSFSVRVSCGNSEYAADIGSVPAMVRRSYTNEPISSVFGFTAAVPSRKCGDLNTLKWTISACGSEIASVPVHTE